MATLDFSKALQSMIDDKSSDSKTNRRMVKTLYAPEINALHKQAIMDYEDAIARTSKQVKDRLMSKEQAADIVENYKQAMQDVKQFRKEFFEE